MKLKDKMASLQRSMAALLGDATKQVSSTQKALNEAQKAYDEACELYADLYSKTGKTRGDVEPQGLSKPRKTAKKEKAPKKEKVAKPKKEKVAKPKKEKVAKPKKEKVAKPKKEKVAKPKKEKAPKKEKKVKDKGETLLGMIEQVMGSKAVTAEELLELLAQKGKIIKSNKPVVYIKNLFSTRDKDGKRLFQKEKGMKGHYRLAGNEAETVKEEKVEKKEAVAINAMLSELGLEIPA